MQSDWCPLRRGRDTRGRYTENVDVKRTAVCKSGERPQEKPTLPTP